MYRVLVGVVTGVVRALTQADDVARVPATAVPVETGLLVVCTAGPETVAGRRGCLRADHPVGYPEHGAAGRGDRQRISSTVREFIIAAVVDGVCPIPVSSGQA